MTEAEKQPQAGQQGEGEKTSGEAQLRTDGPTPEQWIDAGYDLKDYPPKGYVAKESDPKSSADKSGDSEAKTAGASNSTADPLPQRNIASKEPVTETVAEVKAPAPLPVPTAGEAMSLESLAARVSALEQVVHAQVGSLVGSAPAGTHSLLYRWWEDMKTFFEG